MPPPPHDAPLNDYLGAGRTLIQHYALPHPFYIPQQQAGPPARCTHLRLHSISWQINSSMVAGRTLPPFRTGSHLRHRAGKHLHLPYPMPTNVATRTFDLP